MFVTFKNKIYLVYVLAVCRHARRASAAYVYYVFTIYCTLYGYFVDSAENLRRDSWEKNNSIQGDVWGGGALRETVNLVLFLDPVLNTVLLMK